MDAIYFGLAGTAATPPDRGALLSADRGSFRSADGRQFFRLDRGDRRDIGHHSKDRQPPPKAGAIPIRAGPERRDRIAGVRAAIDRINNGLSRKGTDKCLRYFTARRTSAPRRRIASCNACSLMSPPIIAVPLQSKAIA